MNKELEKYFKDEYLSIWISDDIKNILIKNYNLNEVHASSFKEDVFLTFIKSLIGIATLKKYYNNQNLKKIQDFELCILHYE